MHSNERYHPKRRKPTAADFAHGRVHFRRQIDIINPEMVVLLGSTACRGVCDAAGLSATSRLMSR